jgi:hypothetical protein
MPLFARRAFGPFTGSGASAPYDACPVAERLCAGEGAWLYQKYLLGSERDTADIADAFEKCWEQRDALRSWWRSRA